MEDLLFGLKGGMTLEEVKKALGGSEPHHESEDRYRIKLDSHPTFDFTANIDSEKGLYFIEERKKESKNIRLEFDSLKVMLSKKYGKPKCKKKGGFFSDKNISWKAEWLSPRCHLPDTVSSISLLAGYGYDDILIKYEFINENEKRK